MSRTTIPDIKRLNIILEQRNIKQIRRMGSNRSLVIRGVFSYIENAIAQNQKTIVISEMLDYVSSKKS